MNEIRRRGRDEGRGFMGLNSRIRKEGFRRKDVAEGELTGDYEGLRNTSTFGTVKINRLGDNAATSTAASALIGLDGGGGGGLSLGSVGGDGEESSEEIH